MEEGLANRMHFYNLFIISVDLFNATQMYLLL